MTALNQNQAPDKEKLGESLHDVQPVDQLYSAFDSAPPIQFCGYVRQQDGNFHVSSVPNTNNATSSFFHQGQPGDDIHSPVHNGPRSLGARLYVKSDEHQQRNEEGHSRYAGKSFDELQNRFSSTRTRQGIHVAQRRQNVIRVDQYVISAERLLKCATTEKLDLLSRYPKVHVSLEIVSRLAERNEYRRR